MSAPKKNARRGSKSRPPTPAQLTVVLEDLRSNFTVFGEALQGMREEMGRRFDEVDRRFEQVDRRFEQVDRRFEQVDRRFEQVDGRIGGIEGDMILVKSAVLASARELKALRSAVDDGAARAERKPDRERS